MAALPLILAVDDDPASLLVLANVLQMDGAFRVVTATNVADAMVVAERHSPDLIITDRYMPGRDGFDFCSWVKSHPVLSASMVMLLTASAEVESIVKGLDLGADDYITKPFNPEELHSRVRALLRIKRLGDQLKNDKDRLEELNAALHESLGGIMHLITHIIELRVPDAFPRSERACTLARWLGEKLELEKESLTALVLAARIHEIGKIVMPDDVLGHGVVQLSGEQKETLMQFPTYGHMLVSRIPQLGHVASLIKHQLENFDGTGSPDHLRGKQIPLGARILRMVNVLEQMPINATPVQISEELDHLRGTTLDPFVVQGTIEYITTLSDPAWMQGKKQVAIGSIEEGMVTAADICTAKGIKLLPRDTKLTQSHINWIQTHHQKDPVLSGIYVYFTQ
ncbi:MAG TPA: HD domain-containing phosphohydrolase [Bacteroidota bacterium]|nr:HD domain-containing phosphohydrolase [Bacteroidota bacterium]